jgi:hypothetical protein
MHDRSAIADLLPHGGILDPAAEWLGTEGTHDVGGGVITHKSG